MPNLKLTKTAIDKLNLAPKDDQFFYWDTDLRGFGIRVGSVSKTFIVQKDISGKTRRVSIGKFGLWTPEEARKEAREKLLLMDKGIDLTEQKRLEKAQSITLVTAWKVHKEIMIRKNCAANTIADYDDCFGRYLIKWQNRNLAKITRADVRKEHSRLGEVHGTYAANGAFRQFRAVYNTAMRESEFLPPNPCIAVQWFKEYRRQEPIPDNKLAQWYKEVQTIQNDIRRDYQLFVIFTGLRRRDATHIKWEDIDIEAATLHRPNPKGGKERAFTLPLPDICIEIIKRRESDNKLFFGKSCPWLFPTRSQKDKSIIPLSETKELKRHLPSAHRLRDTYTTAANAAGLSPYDIEVLTNHRPAKSSVTAGYINQSIEHLRVQQQRVADYLKQKIGLDINT